MQCKGVSAHLHRSDKGYKRFEEICKAMNMEATVPPRHAEPRWGGIIPMFMWCGF